jgi:hypothetical protein
MGFHVANAVFAIAQDLEDRQPGWMGEDFKQLRPGFERLGFRIRFFKHIQTFAYDHNRRTAKEQQPGVTWSG